MVLYVVATPIGNLEDLSPRAARILREVALIAAEDTRRTRQLLSHLGLHTRLTSLHRDSPPSRLEEILAVLRRADVALVSDAGTPTISDPGTELIAAAAAEGIDTVSVPGPCAAIAALSVSGLPGDRVLFAGFLPRQGKPRAEALAELSQERATLVLYEAPHRLLATLRDLREAFGDRRIACARELTKAHEEVIRGTIGEVERHFTEVEPRGEFTLVIEGRSQAAAAVAPDDAAILRRLGELSAAGVSRSRAVSVVAAETGLSRRRVYALALGAAVTPWPPLPISGKGNA